MSSLSARIPSRLRAADPIIPALAVISFVVYLMHGFDKALTRDLGVYVYGGQRWLAGDVPYQGILNRAGPLAHMLPGIGTGLGRLFGIDDIHAARAFFTLMAVACVCLVYVLVRNVLGSRTAGVIAAMAFLCFRGIIEYSTGGPREKTAMVLFLLVAMLALHHRRWATAGVFTALGTLTWQPVFFVVAAMAVAAIVLAPKGRFSALLRYAVGGAVTTLAMLAYYALNGALHTFFDGFLILNYKYTEQASALDGSKLWLILQQGYGNSIWLIILGLAVQPVLSVLAVRPAWRTREPGPVTEVTLGVGWAAGVAWSFVAFNGWPDLFPLLPMAALGIGGLAATVIHAVDRRVSLRVVEVFTAVISLVLIIWAVGMARETSGIGLREQRASVNAVLSHGPKNPTILSVQAPEVLVMAHMKNPTRIQMFTNGFPKYVDDTWPGGIQGYGRWIAKKAPTYIVVENGFPKSSWLYDVLRKDYVLTAGAPHWRWWVNKSVPPEVRHEIRRSNIRAKHREVVLSE